MLQLLAWLLYVTEAKSSERTPVCVNAIIRQAADRLMISLAQVPPHGLGLGPAQRSFKLDMGSASVVQLLYIAYTVSPTPSNFDSIIT